MAKSKPREVPYLCPVGRFFHEMDKTAGRKSPFLDHLANSGAEFLKAIRFLVDDAIERMEKRTPGPKEKVTKIKVE